MPATKGKLTNKESGEALNFSVNPTEFTLRRQFDFSVEPCVGQSASVVAFRGGGNSTLMFHLRFDKDVGDNTDPAKVFTFLKGLNAIVEAKKSVSTVEFSLGSFTFLGYVSAFTYQPTRFDDKGNATSVMTEFNLISNGEYEGSK